MDFATLNEYAKDPLVQHYISVVMVAYPVSLIFARAGFSRIWTLMLLVPYFGIVLCAGYLALNRWPKLPVRSKAGGK